MRSRLKQKQKTATATEELTFFQMSSKDVRHKIFVSSLSFKILPSVFSYMYMCACVCVLCMYVSLCVCLCLCAVRVCVPLNAPVVYKAEVFLVALETYLAV